MGVYKKQRLNPDVSVAPILRQVFFSVPPRGLFPQWSVAFPPAGWAPLDWAVFLGPGLNPL